MNHVRIVDPGEDAEHGFVRGDVVDFNRYAAALAEHQKNLPINDAIGETLADLGCEETPANVAAAVEFLLEGLHLSKRLNKDAVDGRATYRSRSGNR